MIGKLTTDKASMNISYFLYSVIILRENNGIISRKDFGQKMADFIGLPYEKNGKENRTPYNKTKLPRYFGFIDLRKELDGTSSLVLTRRGIRLAKIISSYGDSVDAENRYYIASENQEDFTNMFMESVLFDSFGKNNCGAEKSNTDVEPPKIVFKTIAILKYAAAAEIFYIMHGLNRGVFSSYEEALNKVQKNRAVHQYDYSAVLAEWELSNIANDCKIINIFTDNSIRLLLVDRDEATGQDFYRLNPNTAEKYLNEILKLNPIYAPLQMAVTSSDNKIAVQWVDDVIMGRISNPECVFRCDFQEITTQAELVNCVLAPAAIRAFDDKKENIYLVVNNAPASDFFRLLGDFSGLFVRVCDLISNANGCSNESVSNQNLYLKTIEQSPGAKKYLRKGSFSLPENLHVILIESGAVDMSKDYDFTFKQCLVETKADSEEKKQQDDTSGFPVRTPRTAKTPALNMILYGAPGTGKTYITADYAVSIVEQKPLDEIFKLDRDVVMQRYNKLVDQGYIVFTTFHQSYGYEEFIQGLRPDTEADKLVFKPVDGVFKKIANLAINDTERNYVIIIDEINRANISKVFGELITLIEDDKRWGEVNGLSVMLPSGQRFAIPNNLFIIGTMNSADKSISLIDTALRRRFSFVEVTPDANQVSDVSLREVLTKLNMNLYEELESTDLLIGHAYFIGKDSNDLCTIMNNNIIPLLYEYFYDNRKKVENILKKSLDGMHVHIVGNTFGRVKIEKD